VVIFNGLDLPLTVLAQKGKMKESFYFMTKSKLQKIKKRDGQTVDWDQSKITNAIYKAITATGQGDGEISKRLSERVAQILKRRFKDEEIPNVEQVQDIVEEVLVLDGLVETAKAYILYREQRRRVREAMKVVDESSEMVDRYLRELDWQIQENANMTFSLQGLNQYAIKEISKKYWLNKIYPKEIREAANNEDFHIHDLEALAPYCAGWDLYDLLLKGFGGVPSKIESRPPKHFRTALGQLVNFLFTLQGETAGANAVSNFDTLLAPFIRYDNLSYLQVKQSMQEFLYNCMVPTRVGFQSLCWDELVVVKDRGKIKFIEIGKLVDKEFKKNSHRIIEQNPQSYAVQNHEDYYTLSFDSQGKAVWAKAKAFVRHKVPKKSEFVKIKTNRGEAKVSRAHSLFSFKEFDGSFNPQPKSAENIKIIKHYSRLDKNNHFISLRSFENKGKKDKLDLVELLDEIPQLHKNVFVQINPTHTLDTIRANILSEKEAFLPFYKEFGLKDRGVWQDWLDKKSIRYEIWRKYGDLSKNFDFKLKNSDCFYPRILKGEALESFVKLCAWYITEGHSSVSTPLYISQSPSENSKEIIGTLKKLNALGEISENESYSCGKKADGKVFKITGKGLLSEIISRNAGYLAFNKVIPSFVFELSPKYQKLFIETLLKGDGSEYDTHWDFSTTSKKLSLSLSFLLSQNNYKFAVYSEESGNRKWHDKWKIRIYKKHHKTKKEYCVNDFEARACLRVDKFKYDREYEYDISVDLPQENFAGGSGLLMFHNTPFLNVSLDIKVPGFYKKQPVIIGGKPQKETYGEFQEEMNMFIRAFYEGLMEGDAKGRPMTFPIPTVSITKDFAWDDPSLDPLWEATAKYGVNYFSNFVQSDMKPEDARSMCPLGGNEKVLIKSSRNRGLEYSGIRWVYEGHSKQKSYWIYSDGKFVEGKFNKFENQEMIKVVLVNNHSIEMSKEHLNFVVEGERSKTRVLKGKELKIGMYLPYSLKSYKGEGGDRNLGYFVGAYAGDGSLDRDTSVIFSLNKGQKNSVIKKLQEIAEKYFGAHFTITQSSDTKLLTLKVHSKAAVGLCRDFVNGREREKYYASNLFKMSKEFRQGIIEGHYATDGGNRNRIYTSSPKMVETLNMLAATLGTTTSIYKDNRGGRLGNEANFAVLFYQLNRQKLENIWFKKNKKLWVKIKSIEKIPNTTAYCFEVKNNEPLFTIGTTGVLTHNCRLRLDNRELYKRGGGLFGAAPSTGSIGVVTVNMPRIGYLSKTKKEFFNRLGHLMDLAKESLEIKRKALENFMEKGLYPYSKYYLAPVKQLRGGYFGNHFATIGLIGMNEALLNFIEEDIASRGGRKFSLEVLDFMRERLVRYQEETGNLYNLEATPGEGTAYRQAKADKEKYSDIITAGTKEVPYYTNSSHLPVNYTDDIFEALKLQDELQCRYTGGTVAHLFLGEKLSDPATAKNLVRKVFEKFHLPYITLTPTFSICPNHGYINGEHFECPKCIIKQPCEVYSRVVGYLRPLQQWNSGKKEEFRWRKEYKVYGKEKITSLPQEKTPAS